MRHVKGLIIDMNQIMIKAKSDKGISEETLKSALESSLSGQMGKLKKVMLIPPDFTRMYSGAGKITAYYYKLLHDTCTVDIMPALGTHDAMTKEECTEFFGNEVPFESILRHDFRKDVVKIGEVPASYVKEVSGGLLDNAIDVELNRRLLDASYDLIISIGQVVPHEVVGMANYSKNLFVGCGGSNMISQSHMLGAFYGLEKMMGKDFSPVRKVFDYAQEHFIKDMPLMYVLTVTSKNDCDTAINGLFIGSGRKIFEEAVTLSQEKNITYVEKALPKVVVYLDPREFKSTWLGNKSVYRTRMAIADGGELVILAPGVRKFGEDDAIDALIRKYGYVGRKKILKLVKANQDLQENLACAAHLILSSTEGRFKVTYAVEKLTQKEVEGVNFCYMKFSDALKIYDPEKLKDGFQTLPNGEEIFYVSNPALGLWSKR